MGSGFSPVPHSRRTRSLLYINGEGSSAGVNILKAALFAISRTM